MSRVDRGCDVCVGESYGVACSGCLERKGGYDECGVNLSENFNGRRSNKSRRACAWVHAPNLTHPTSKVIDTPTCTLSLISSTTRPLRDHTLVGQARHRAKQDIALTLLGYMMKGSGRI